MHYKGDINCTSVNVCLGLLRFPSKRVTGKKRRRKEKKKTTQKYTRKSGKFTGSGAKGRVTQQERLPGFPKNDSAFCRERSVCRKLNHASRKAHVVREYRRTKGGGEEKRTISLGTFSS